MALIIGMPFLYYGTKFYLTGIFLNILKVILFVSDWQKYKYQMMGHFSKTCYTCMKSSSVQVHHIWSVTGGH